MPKATKKKQGRPSGTSIKAELATARALLTNKLLYKGRDVSYSTLEKIAKLVTAEMGTRQKAELAKIDKAIKALEAKKAELSK